MHLPAGDHGAGRASGAGTSTLSSMILRDTDPQAGTVHLVATAGPVDVRTPVLILDEAVSQLDTDNEDAVRVAFTGTGRTTIVIAHRLSTLLHAERILVLDRGAVVGDGTHPRLLTDCPAYTDLVGPQLRSPLAELG